MSGRQRRHRAAPTALLLYGTMLLVGQMSPTLPSAGFPQIADPDTVRIALDQQAAYWGGRAYRIEIHGDGRAWFKAVTVFGNRARIPLQVKPEALEALVARFRQAEFFKLKPAYIASITHIAATEITLCIDVWCKTVTERMGFLAQMPKSYAGLAGEIVDTAGATALVEAFD
jgi:hypothetical protein